MVTGILKKLRKSLFFLLTAGKKNGKGPQNRLVEPFDWGGLWEQRRKLIDRPTGRHERLVLKDDPARYFSWNVLINAIRPEKSAVFTGAANFCNSLHI